jgi:superfamily II DNA or RNA helicase
MAPRERAEVLPRFRDGALQLLVAPRALDEGVDVAVAERVTCLRDSPTSAGGHNGPMSRADRLGQVRGG